MSDQPMHPEDLRRKQLERTLPTHPPDPAARGEVDKVVPDEGGAQVNDYNDPPPEGASKSTGEGLDDVGGPGLGQGPCEPGAAGKRDRDTRADVGKP